MGGSSQNFTGGVLGKILQDNSWGRGAKIRNHKIFCGRKGGKPGWRGGLQENSLDVTQANNIYGEHAVR